MEKNILELSDELFKEILEKDKELKVLFVRSLRKAFENDKINFVVKMTASDLLRAMEYVVWEEMKKEIEKGIENVITRKIHLQINKILLEWKEKLMEITQKQAS
ncbi:MAG: hypothetical protein QXO99_08425 [Candidatus Methanomethylicia archaeon]